ncbi:MAG: hypothetical protein U9O41_06085, partial [Candidatus Aerophobetes bacterium]|nr:hypothetical protein [Candidatus Aerophobetes bacterium]
EMRFILRRKPYNLTKKEVEEKMRRKLPEPINKHYVFVNDEKYPPKQVLNEVLGLNRLDFTTMDTRNIFKRLGFEFGQLF